MDSKRIYPKFYTSFVMFFCGDIIITSS